MTFMILGSLIIGFCLIFLMGIIEYDMNGKFWHGITVGVIITIFCVIFLTGLYLIFN
jgi:hypothetical protein